MRDHEYFQELSALATIGQTSPSEERELAAHLRECTECNNVHSDFIRISQRQLPHADPIRWRLKSEIPTPGLDADIRARFIARARVEGIDFCLDETERPKEIVSPSPRLKPLAWRSFAVAAFASSMVVAVWFGQKYHFESRGKSQAFSVVPTRRDIADASPISNSVPEVGSIAANDPTNSESEALQRSEIGLKKQLDETRQQVANLSTALQETEAEKNALAEQNQQQMANTSELRSQNDNLNRQKTELLAARAGLEEQVRKLDESIQEKTAMLEREHELMVISKDVRQLMGARNLLILDVHDIEGGGKSAKAFGRVFYAEGQSLIFYAFDLSNGGRSPAKYTFEAWGQKEPGGRSIRNLGTFEVDDHEQHRWVLKVNDPVLLSGIDSVFVTAESKKDDTVPHERKLMYAYLGQPNHP